MTKNKTKSGVLKDHKKVGKTYIPPYVYLLGEGRDIQWRQRIIPEYLWLCLLNFRLGWAAGADLSLSLARLASRALGIEPEEFEKQFGNAPKQFFGLTTAYGSLDEIEKQRTIELLTKDGKLDALRQSLSSLISLYPECPLNFIYDTPPDVSEDDLPVVQELVRVMFDETVTLTVSALTSAVYIAFCTNKLRVIVGDDRSSQTDPELKNFREIEKYPTTETSKRVAQSVRLTASMLAHPDEELSTIWCEYFWNRGLEIGKCGNPPLNKLEID